jgi:hypothetical protein
MQVFWFIRFVHCEIASSVVLVGSGGELMMEMESWKFSVCSDVVASIRFIQPIAHEIQLEVTASVHSISLARDQHHRLSWALAPHADRAPGCPLWLFPQKRSRTGRQQPTPCQQNRTSHRQVAWVGMQTAAERKVNVNIERT